MFQNGSNHLEKQTKNRNETGSDLSLDERLTRLSKRLSRKRCCDTTPDRYQKGSRLTILLRIVKKNASFSSKTEGWWDPRA